MRVTKDAERHIRAGHPWVYDQSIEKRSLLKLATGARAGDLVVVFDHNRRFLAIGLYDPASPIRIKILHHGKAKLIDGTFWAERIKGAIQRREQLQANPETSAYRLIHGENDGFPGLVVDRYVRSIVVKAYSSAWIPYLPQLVRLLVTKTGAQNVVLRLARLVAKQETFGLSDGLTVAPSTSGDESLCIRKPVEPVQFLENGLLFSADLIRGHKTGHFLDQRENRAKVRDLAQGTRMLDVFACTGGFGLNAAGGGAHEVTAIDQSEASIRHMRHNFYANRHHESVSSCQLWTIVGDAFEELERLVRRGAKFDLVVLDPPSFAQKKADVVKAEATYRRLTQLGLDVLAPEGIFVQASCTTRVPAERFFDDVQRSAVRAGYDLRPFAKTQHALDHPATFPEGHYLKAVFARPLATTNRARIRL